MTNSNNIEACSDLIYQQRWAALATTRNGKPYCSMVAYAVDRDPTRLLLHLSTLAPHTQRLLKEPRISLAISEPDNQLKDPQQLARITLNGMINPITPTDESYENDKQRYLERLPNAEMLFSFGDFSLYEMKVEQIRYIGGFASAHNIAVETLREYALKREG